jgi:hypothetical protein
MAGLPYVGYAVLRNYTPLLPCFQYGGKGLLVSVCLHEFIAGHAQRLAVGGGDTAPSVQGYPEPRLPGPLPGKPGDAPPAVMGRVDPSHVLADAFAPASAAPVHLIFYRLRNRHIHQLLPDTHHNFIMIMKNVNKYTILSI